MLITVKVITNAPVSELRGTMADGVLKIAIAAVPEKGKANAELIRFLASHFHCAKNRIIIKRGLTSNKKLIYVL